MGSGRGRGRGSHKGLLLLLLKAVTLVCVYIRRKKNSFFSVHLQCFSVCIIEDFFSVRESVLPFLVTGDQEQQKQQQQEEEEEEGGLSY